MEEEITIWNSERDRHYYYSEGKQTIYFKSKSMKEIAVLDCKRNILYENTDYKNNFKQAKSEIRKDYKGKYSVISEYMNMV